jgi:hypothetical protein
MGDDGRALARELAAGYARDNGFVFLEGSQVKEFWDSSGGGTPAGARGNGTAGEVMNGR